VTLAEPSALVQKKISCRSKILRPYLDLLPPETEGLRGKRKRAAFGAPYFFPAIHWTPE